MFSADGFVNFSGSGNDNSIIPPTNPRIIEISESSPLSLTLDSLNSDYSASEGGIDSNISAPGSGSMSFMLSPDTGGINSSSSTSSSNEIMSPTSRSALAVINAAQELQQQQQQNQGYSAEATLALLSSLGSDIAPAGASAQTPNAANRSASSVRAGRTNSNNVSASGELSTSSSQSLQPLTRQTNGARGNVAAFLTKLYNMVGDTASNSLIKWSDNGQSFLVLNHVEFAKEVLPKFFKHNNFSSFVRQLNMYGFHKVPHIQQGVLMPDADSEQWEFSNPHFQRNQPDLLYLVSRKKATGGNEDKDALTMDLNHIVQEVSAIKRHQVAISTDLKNIERDHQSLWQESVEARERHQRQQETIDKILRFLASVFSGEKKRAIIPNKKARLTITGGESNDAASSSVDDGMRLVEEDDEEVEELRNHKRKRSKNDDGSDIIHATSVSNQASSIPVVRADVNQVGNAKQKQNQNVPAAPRTFSSGTGTLPALPTVSAAASANASFPEYLTSVPSWSYDNNNISNSANLSNYMSILNLPGAPFKFDPAALSLSSTALLPNAVLSPVHHNMLHSISVANEHNNSTNSSSAATNIASNTSQSLASLPSSFAQTPTGSTVTTGVDQITEKMEQLEQSIEGLRQHGLNFDTLDDDGYLSLADTYDPNEFGDLGTTYQHALADTAALFTASSGSGYSSAVPENVNSTTTPTSSSTTSIGQNPRITTVDEEEYLEDLLDLDPV
ncbi:stress-responsive transcription factor hsf1 [Mortierella sp. GBA30]|nr:stress-responsive transcription factor hsf1 [Mortierella sp. GBA30]